MRIQSLGAFHAPLVAAFAAALLAGCSVPYQRHHQTTVLRLYHNGDHPPHGLEPAWAEMALRAMAVEFGVPLERIAPVDVYLDCDESSTRPSRFNRFTKSIVLRLGQADLRRLYIHELSHLLLDDIDGWPPYWVDQGLAMYMESRCGDFGKPSDGFLLPPRLERHPSEIERIASAEIGDVVLHVCGDSIDQVWSWATPFIHYLLRFRWAGRPMPQRVRQLVELARGDVEQLAPAFLDFYAGYDPIEDFVLGYLESDRSTRLGLLAEIDWRPREDRRRLLERLLAIENAPDLRRLIALDVEEAP